MTAFLDILADSALDTLELVPFLLLTYLAMETLEHASSGKAERLIARAGTSGPVIGALLGALPQCGFSAMAGTLYAGRIITAGTLVAVILSTSDEMVPVFLAHQVPPVRMLALMAAKVVVGLSVGLVVDAVLRATHRTGDGKPHVHELCERAHCGCDDDWEGEVVPSQPAGAAASPAPAPGMAFASAQAAPEAPAPSPAAAAGAHAHAHTALSVVRSALVHTGEVTLFIFAITLAFGLLIGYVGEDSLAAFLGVHPLRATLLAALVGLIPNCGASVAITELYLNGSLAAGPMFAGLLVSGGMGLLVLFRTNANQRQNVLVTLVVYAVGVACGLVVSGTGIVF